MFGFMKAKPLLILTVMTLLSGGTLASYLYKEKQRKGAQVECAKIQHREVLNSLGQIAAEKVASGNNRIALLNRVIGDMVGRTRTCKQFVDSLEAVKGIGLAREEARVARAQALDQVITNHVKAARARGAYAEALKGVVEVGVAKEEGIRARVNILENLTRAHAEKTTTHTKLMASLKHIAATGKAKVEAKESLAALMTKVGYSLILQCDIFYIFFNK